MYLMKSDKYECDFCGKSMKWDETDDTHGNMWECEKCGKHFCSKCFVERHGTTDHMKMLLGEKILCPDCWEGLNYGN